MKRRAGESICFYHIATMALKLILLAALAVASDASSILREAKDNVKKQMTDQNARRTQVIDPPPLDRLGPLIPRDAFGGALGSPYRPEAPKPSTEPAAAAPDASDDRRAAP